MPPGFGRASFTDRVMARVAQEPRPTPARVFLRSLRHLALRDAFAALRTAWRLALEPGQPVPRAARARSAALLLGVVLVVGVATPAFFSSMRALLGSNGPAPIELEAGAPSSAQPSAPPTPTPSLPPTPRSTPRPSPTPPATRRPSADARALETRPQPTKDHVDDEEAAAKARRDTPEPRERERDDEAEHEDE